MFKRSSTARAMTSTLSQTSPNVQVQKLPLKCVGSIDNLVGALQELTEKPGGFKVEMRHNSYIITSDHELKRKDILARIASKEDMLSSSDSVLALAQQEGCGDVPGKQTSNVTGSG